MKSEDFKNLLKPLIEKTVREVLLQEGVLSRVVSEVAKGLNENKLVESRKNTARASQAEDKEKEALYKKQKAERIRRLNESANLGEVFSGTQELPASPGHQGPLSGVSSADRGVDISGIQKLSKGRWKALAGGK